MKTRKLLQYISLIYFLLIITTEVKGQSWTIYNKKNSGITDNQLWYVAVAPDGTKLVSSFNKGYIEFNGGATWKIFNPSNSSFPDYFSTSIFIDKNGNKWIGTIGKGVIKYDGSTWINYNTSNSAIPDDRVYGFAEDLNGDIWICTYSGGVGKFNGSIWTAYNTGNSGLTNNYVTAITIDKYGNKWFGTGFGTGLCKFDGATWTVFSTSAIGFPGTDIWALKFDKAGNFWVGTTHGVTKFNGSIWTTYSTSNSGLPGNYVRSIVFAPNGDAWIGTGFKGLAKFDGTNWTTFKKSNSGIPSDSIWSVAVDTGLNEIWVATYTNGLGKLSFCTTSTGVISALRDTICSGTPASLSVTGSSGNIQWQSSLFSSKSFNSVIGAGNSSFIDLPLQTTFYRVFAVNGSCTDTSAAYKITVKPSPLADFAYNGTGLNLNFNSAGSSGDVTKYEWDFGDGGTSTVQNPSHVYGVKDTFHVCLTVHNGSNCSFTLCRDVDLLTGVETINTKKYSLAFYPNPVDEYTNLIINGTAEEEFELSLTNVLGQKVKYLKGRTGTVTRISRDNLTSGIYMYEVRIKDVIAAKGKLSVR